jgi:Na+-transporting NADH:ubiquinone oxidoreductase subunit NqrA
MAQSKVTINWQELLATGAGAAATALYLNSVANTAGQQRATEDAILSTALGAAFAAWPWHCTGGGLTPCP